VAAFGRKLAKYFINFKALQRVISAAESAPLWYSLQPFSPVGRPPQLVVLIRRPSPPQWRRPLGLYNDEIMERQAHRLRVYNLFILSPLLINVARLVRQSIQPFSSRLCLGEPRET